MSVIFGVVRDPIGNPVPHARVSFAVGPVPLRDIAALTDNNGTFAFSAPVAGEYIIEVFSEEFDSKKVKIAVESNREKHIDVFLSRSEG
jgi:hypothetical protein